MWIIRDLLKGFGYLLIVFAAIKLLAMCGVMIFGQGREPAWALRQVKWAIIFATAGIALTRIRQTYVDPDKQHRDPPESS